MSIGLVFSNVEADRLIAAAVQMERLAACEHSRQIDLLVAGRHAARQHHPLRHETSETQLHLMELLAELSGVERGHDETLKFRLEQRPDGRGTYRPTHASSGTLWPNRFRIEAHSCRT